MRLDYVTIFPAFFDALGLSLPGRAAQAGLLDVHVHDLRDFTHDRHRTVDDTPAGGGAGMVMRPEPWGEALDTLLGAGEGGATAVVVVPTPSGTVLTQALARRLSAAPRLLFACGRYEGIDQRVLDHARTRPDVAEVVEVSLGDYVLNGGEVAALAVTEAVVRLLPGFMGNAASLVEESHEDGLLEYPVYTRPAEWRGLAVPDVLRSGDHGRIAAWRHDQARARTAERRPDLLPPAAVAGPDGPDGPGAWRIAPAVRADAGELLVLQRACWLQEAQANGTMTGIPALEETLADVEAWVGGADGWRTWVARAGERLVGAVRGRFVDGGPGREADADPRAEGRPAWDIGRLMVAPDLQGRGLGRALLTHVQDVADPRAEVLVLHTGFQSTANIAMYRRAGFRLRRDLPAPHLAVTLTKPRPPT